MVMRRLAKLSIKSMKYIKYNKEPWYPGIAASGVGTQDLTFQILN